MANTTWKAWFDGATQGSNPGVRGIGGLLLGPSGERIEIAEEIGMGTNNEAEYMALMAVLDAAIEGKRLSIGVIAGWSAMRYRSAGGFRRSAASTGAV